MRSIVVVVCCFWAVVVQGQCTISWVGNTFGDNPHHIGNGARSMWVSPGGMIYTASLWDENGRNIGVYHQGRVLGAMGGTKQSQGSAIGGDSTWLFTAQQAPNAGRIGRYNRSTGIRDLLFPASSGTGDAIQGIAVFDHKVYVSDAAGGHIRIFTAGGVPLRQWTMAGPGALAVDSGGHVWVACYDRGLIREYDSTGKPGAVIRMGAHCHPGALYVDNARGQLLVGDEGPDMNIKIYASLSGVPALVSTFGVRGGYLDATTGIRGQTGDKRFTRIRGIARDGRGCLYVLNNPWGGSWDLGRNGATDIHCYDSSGHLQWTLQALNFEGNAAADPGTDGADLYSGNAIYHFTGTGGGDYKANTIDPFKYPGDVRIRVDQRSRGEHFGQLACVDGHRILVASGQNPDDFYTYYFNPATDGFIAIPGDTIAPHVRNGFQLDAAGNIWLGQEDTIRLLPLRGFTAGGKPIRGPVVSTPAPASTQPLNRIGYLPASDRMVLAGGSSDWTCLGNHIEVYKGWLAGNRLPGTVITLTRGTAKSMAVAGDYVFIGYYAMPAIDIFDLNTGRLVQTLLPADGLYAGNDVDSEYGLLAYHTASGKYLITKDDYNASKVVVYTWDPKIDTVPCTAAR